MDSAEPTPHEPRVRLDPDGVICIDFSGCSRITLELAELVNRRHRELVTHHPAPVLMLGERVGRVDYAAQRYASAPAVREVVSAMALVTGSFLQRHLARMFLMYHRPPYPVQVFADEPAARAWLARQIETVT
jgi:hypothetical protein